MTTITNEDRVVLAILEIADARHGLEQAAVPDPSARSGNESEAERIVREHGFDKHRLLALRGLAESRAIPLETVLRAALRGELASVVQLPARPRRTLMSGTPLAEAFVRVSSDPSGVKGDIVARSLAAEEERRCKHPWSPTEVVVNGRRVHRFALIRDG